MNSTVLNETLSVTKKTEPYFLSVFFMFLVATVYVVGIVGNALAIIVLRRGERRIRNRKHLLLLTSLAANDLVALIGMLTAMIVSQNLPWVQETRAFCATRVVLRVFGMGSVCIAVNMALERYLALTRPFVYQKQITYVVIRSGLLVSWCWVAVLTCAPIMGFGLYFDEATHTCTRYRNAKELADYIFAIIYVFIGTLLCGILVYCNLAVIRALYAISAPTAGEPPIVRRVSKSSCRLRQQHSVKAPTHHNAATAEEVAFSRLMATLSVMFVLCWMPNMVTSILFLVYGPEKASERFKVLAWVSDVLMLLNYVLNPILYVLMRKSRFSATTVSKAVASCFKHRGHKSSSESSKVSCCPQDTLIVSDHSSQEMTPLKPCFVPTASIIRIDD